MASHTQFPINCSQYSDTKFTTFAVAVKKENSKFIARFSNIQLGFQVILKKVIYSKRQKVHMNMSRVGGNADMLCFPEIRYCFKSLFLFLFCCYNKYLNILLVNRFWVILCFL